MQTFEEFIVGRNRALYPRNDKHPQGYVGVMIYKEDYDKFTESHSTSLALLREAKKHIPKFQVGYKSMAEFNAAQQTLTSIETYLKEQEK